MALFSTMALKATQGKTPFKYLGVINDGTVNQGYLEYSTDQVLTKNAKFAVEFAYGDFVHIRSCLTNKYWVRSSSSGNWIVAQGIKPEVHTGSWTCTLFRMDITDDKRAKFYHVQSGRSVCIPNDGSTRKMFLSIDPAASTEAVSLAVDYDSLIILPKFVAFKGSNGLYCKTYIADDPYPHFSVSDIGDPNIVCETLYNSDGKIRFRAVSFTARDMFWSYTSPSSEDLIIRFTWNRDAPAEQSQMFDAIKVDKNVIALRSLGNNKFCKRADVKLMEEKKDRLVANADGVLKDCYLQVVEPVFSRKVNVYEFDIDNARVYNVTLLYSQEHSWDNYSTETQSGTADGTISTAKSRTYSNSISVGGSVSTTFETGLPFIADGKIKVSATASYTHQWDQTIEETQQVGDIFTVVVKPMKRTIAKGVSTKGTCDVPFAYVQKDYPASGGQPIITKLYDGVFTGANAYGFHSEVRYEDLPAYNGPRHLAPTKCIKHPVVPARK